MGRNKFSASEIYKIRKLLRLKLSGTRFQQKQVRHKLRTEYDFNISDFGVQGQAFGPEELDICINKKIIEILDDATIENMKKRYREQKEYQEKLAQEIAIEKGEQTSWEEALKQWEEENGKIENQE